MRTRSALSLRSVLLAMPLSVVFAHALGGCSGAVPPGGSGGAGSGGLTGSGGALGSGGAVGSGGAATGGAGTGGAGTGGLTGSGGAAVGSGGAAAGGNGGASGGDSGSGGAASGGSGGGSDCTPNPSGTFVVDGDVVFDEKTCLTWMKANTSGDPYAAAVTYCDGLDLGGYTDWRIPTAGEVVSIFKCDGMFPPIDAAIFDVTGDGIWTTTETGTIAGDLPKVCGAGQSSGQFYDFGQVGGQNTRCVRGPITLPDRTDCKTVTAICPP